MATTVLKWLRVARTQDVWVVTFLDNAFTPEIIGEMHTVLDQIEKTEGASAVVFASSGKIFSGGMNIKWILEQLGQGNNRGGIDLFCLCMKLFSRLIVFPIPTVAAIAGHCFAGGLMFALALDHRVMAEAGATICMSEINYNLPLPQGGVEVLRAKLHPKYMKDLLLTGRKLTSQEAFEGKIMDLLTPKERVLQASIDLAQSLADIGTRRVAYRLIKLQLYGHAAEVCNAAKFTPEELQAGTGGFAKL